MFPFLILHIQLVLIRDSFFFSFAILDFKKQEDNRELLVHISLPVYLRGEQARWFKSCARTS